jgi:hypothetical protein
MNTGRSVCDLNRHMLSLFNTAQRGFEVRLGVFLGRRCIHQRPVCISCFYRSAATDARALLTPSAIAIWSAQATRAVTKSLP